MTDISTVLCAWCGKTLAEVPLPHYGAPVWYGVCGSCHGGSARGLFPTQSLYGLSQPEYDALPFGLLELDPDGRVLQYNSAEESLTGLSRESVLGKLFFTDVAPCTRVREFEGTFRDMVAAGESGRQAFDFLFRFAEGDRFVHIAMCYEAVAQRAVILVQAAEEAGA